MNLHELATRIKATEEFPVVDVEDLDSIDYIRLETLRELRYEGIKGHALDNLISGVEGLMKKAGHTFTNRYGYEFACWQSFIKAVVNGEYDSTDDDNNGGGVKPSPFSPAKPTKPTKPAKPAKPTQARSAMIRAWQIRRTAALRWGCKVGEIDWSECLKTAWREVKSTTITKAA